MTDGHFIAAQTANAMVWQRYSQPFCLILLALAAGRTAGPEDRPPPRCAAGPVMLAALPGSRCETGIDAPMTAPHR